VRAGDRAASDESYPSRESVDGRRRTESDCIRWSGPWLKKSQTKGGEALPETVAESKPLPWRVAWTRSNCEQLVYDQLAPKGFHLFLPTADAWSRRGGLRVRARIPLFRGYLFLRHAVDKSSYLEVCKARGLVRLLGQRWDQLEVVPDSEIVAIQKLVRSELPIFPYPYLREGQRVRITDGPLADVEGILVRANPKKGLVVVSVDLLRRSVAVQLDCTLMEAA
jgi:transcription termination/antitermination protein NusG